MDIAAAQPAVFLGYDDAAEAQLVHLVYENTHVELPAVYLQRVRAHALFGVFAVDLLEL